MPSNKVLTEKQQIVKNLADRLKNSAAGVLVEYKGINVADDTVLRSNFRAANIKYDVVKNTLLKLAAKEAGLEDLSAVLEGTTSLATSDDDVVASAKVINDFIKKNEKIGMKIKAGFLDGKVISDKEVQFLAELPSKEVLVAQVLGGLNAPITGLVNVLNGNIRGLACALNAIAEKKQAS